jgi:hypothetical protein
VSEYYKEIKKAEEESRELILRVYSPSLTFKDFKKIAKEMESPDNLEELSKNSFELGISAIKNDIIPTKKAMRTHSFTLAYQRFCIFSGKNIGLDHAIFDLYKLYGQGKSLTESVLMNPVFMLTYNISMMFYKTLMK